VNASGDAVSDIIQLEKYRGIESGILKAKPLTKDQLRQLGGRLGPVLDSIRAIHGLGLWMEIVTLVVPGFNDSDQELREIVGFIAGVSRDIPWHVTAFHPDYRMTAPPPTSPHSLSRAAAIASEAGLRYVYTGNVAGGLEDTRCPACGELLVVRRGYRVRECRLAGEGRCPGCGRLIPGRWRPGRAQAKSGNSRLLEAASRRRRGLAPRPSFLFCFQSCKMLR
jgi:pyruvate formate lyase activating enzyme